MFYLNARKRLASRVHLGIPTEAKPELNSFSSEFIDKVIALLRIQSGQDFSRYKKSAIARRIERRMGLHQLHRMADYLRYLGESPKECELLFNELLIGVTSFFRDGAVWNQLRAKELPALVATHPDGAALRAWVPGCATGEEAYSLAIVFKEALDEILPAKRYSLQIFASDLDKDAIATGHTGVYPRSIASDVSAQRLQRFFVEDPSGYRVCDEIREMVIFAEQNIIVAPPFIQLDILCCRNLLIYFEPELQAKLMQLFHYSLNPGGYLLLGRAESIGMASKLFTPLNEKARIFRRNEALARMLPVDFPAAFAGSSFKPGRGASLEQETLPAQLNLEWFVERQVLQRYAPATVLVTAQGEIRCFCGKTGPYLEPAAGKPNLNLFAMAREGLKQGLSDVFYRAVRNQVAATLKHAMVARDSGAQCVNVLVQPLSEPAALSGMVLVAFYDVATPQRQKSLNSSAALRVEDTAAHHAEELAQDLQNSREEAWSTREEMQILREEWKLTCEELESTQEELTASREEIQTMNEELQAISHEFKAKAIEFWRTNNDMKNLVDSAEIATLFLDQSLNVRYFTPLVSRVVKLTASDAGRPVTDLVTDLDYPDMLLHAREVLRTLICNEVEVPTMVDGRWFKVRTMPYRTQDNHIDGLVMTFLDITARKKLEIELHANQAKMQALIDISKLRGVEHGVS